MKALPTHVRENISRTSTEAPHGRGENTPLTHTATYLWMRLCVHAFPLCELFSQTTATPVKVSGQIPVFLRGCQASATVLHGWPLTATRPPDPVRRPVQEHIPGIDLFSHTVASAVPSALEGLTTVFGMGTGGSPPPWTPGKRIVNIRELISRPVTLENCTASGQAPGPQGPAGGAFGSA